MLTKNKQIPFFISKRKVPSDIEDPIVNLEWEIESSIRNLKDLDSAEYEEFLDHLINLYYTPMNHKRVLRENDQIKIIKTL